MKLQILNILILTFLGTQAQALCYPELLSQHCGAQKSICFSPGSFEVGAVNRITVTQNGVKIDEFEATVIKADTNNDWDGGASCIRLGYPRSRVTLVSSQIDYDLNFYQQANCKYKVQGTIRPR